MFCMFASQVRYNRSHPSRLGGEMNEVRAKTVNTCYVHVCKEGVCNVENKCFDYNWDFPYIKKELNNLFLASIL